MRCWQKINSKEAWIACVLTGAEGAEKIVDGEIISASILSHMRIDGNTRILFLTNMAERSM